MAIPESVSHKDAQKHLVEKGTFVPPQIGCFVGHEVDECTKWYVHTFDFLGSVAPRVWFPVVV